MIQSASSVDNVYAMLAVLCGILATAAMAFFKKEKLWAKLLTFCLLVGLGLYSAFKAANPYDPEAFEKAIKAFKTVQTRDSTRIALAETNLKLLDLGHKVLSLKIDSIVSQRRVSIESDLNKTRNLIKNSKLEQDQAQNAVQRAEQNLWAEAQRNIKWVFDDNGARSKYDRNVEKGVSKYGAVLAAQAHNPAVQNLISKYGKARTEKYIEQLGY